MTICVAQTTPVRGDVESNIAQHLELIRLGAELAAPHASAGEPVVVFPELSLTGYELELAERLAFSMGDARLGPLRDAAREAGATLVVGAPVRLASGLHLGAFVLGADGTVRVYTKHHLGAFDPSHGPEGRVPPPEASVFAPGELRPLIELEEGPAALAICADVSRESHAEEAARRGARAYLASMFVIPSELDADSQRLAERARRHGMVVAFSNFGSATGGLESAGSSAIFSEDGVRRVQLAPEGPGIALASRTKRGEWLTAAVPA